MSDPRVERMARIVVRHALKVKKGENVLIDATDDCEEFILALVDEVHGAGAVVNIQQQSLRIRRAWLKNATDQQFEYWFRQQQHLLGDVDCFLSLRGQDNAAELQDLPAEKMRKLTSLTMNLGLEYRKPKSRKTVIRFPSRSLAQQRGMSYDAFADFFYKVCGMNYQVLHREMAPLKEALDEARMVRIVAPDTDLTFSIEGIQCGISAGTWNIPDGETAMGIVRESANGTIAYNIPSSHQGYTFSDIRFCLKDGKIIESDSSAKERMDAILDTDEGARYIGEFAIGVNPYLVEPMIDTLFDEKMAGSLHFTPAGTAADGTRSYVHWDIIQSHLPAFGGGEIYLDGKLWRKDGQFVDESMSRLNPDELGKILDTAEAMYP